MNSSYNEALKLFKTAFSRMVETVSKKLRDMTIKTKTFDSSTLTLENNTVHICTSLNGVSNLTILYPSGEFVSTVLFSTAKGGKVAIKFPDNTTFVGTEKLEFYPYENWELNIHNGRVAGARLFDNK